jgi:hypothetical protein
MSRADDGKIDAVLWPGRRMRGNGYVYTESVGRRWRHAFESAYPPVQGSVDVFNRSGRLKTQESESRLFAFHAQRNP